MKKRVKTSLFFLISLTLVLLFMASCFSPWTGEMVTVTIRVGGPDSARKLVGIAAPYEYSGFSYRVWVGATEKTDFTRIEAPGGDKLTLTLAGGPQTLTIRAYGIGTYVDPLFPGTNILRAEGTWTGTVSNGIIIGINMNSAMEVNSWQQLAVATAGPLEINAAGFVREEVIYLHDGISAIDWDVTTTININRPITLITNENITINRAVHISQFFIVNQGGSLILKCEGGGSLTLDGSGSATDPLISAGQPPYNNCILYIWKELRHADRPPLPSCVPIQENKVMEDTARFGTVCRGTRGWNERVLLRYGNAGGSLGAGRISRQSGLGFLPAAVGPPPGDGGVCAAEGGLFPELRDVFL